ncbi:hypothetical protein LX36DRAFT_268775 [Colletotrichum falcatum]|nr:hypothetical protein LX36DRAFT_268775 [Colletotrichum falcatum]
MYRGFRRRSWIQGAYTLLLLLTVLFACLGCSYLRPSALHMLLPCSPSPISPMALSDRVIYLASVRSTDIPLRKEYLVAPLSSSFGTVAAQISAVVAAGSSLCILSSPSIPPPRDNSRCETRHPDRLIKLKAACHLPASPSPSPSPPLAPFLCRSLANILSPSGPAPPSPKRRVGSRGPRGTPPPSSVLLQISFNSGSPHPPLQNSRLQLEGKKKRNPNKSRCLVVLFLLGSHRPA